MVSKKQVIHGFNQNLHACGAVFPNFTGFQSILAISNMKTRQRFIEIIQFLTSFAGKQTSRILAYIFIQEIYYDAKANAAISQLPQSLVIQVIGMQLHFYQLRNPSRVNPFYSIHVS